MTDMNKAKTLFIGLLTILLVGCTNKQSEAPTGDIFDEANYPAAEKLLLEAIDNYDSPRMTWLADSLEKTGDISSVTANYYRGGAAVRKLLTTMPNWTMCSRSAIMTYRSTTSVNTCYRR